MNDHLIIKLQGPIAIFGAAGFVGSHLMAQISSVRLDVIGFTRNPKSSWRLKKLGIDKKQIARCDLLNKESINKVIKKYRPKTIFNLAAYGAYSWQEDIPRIYGTNFNSTLTLVECLKKYPIKIYIHAGSQSEYGLNANRPSEDSELLPNSHYAVSKVNTYYLLKYYAMKENFPALHLRLYSVYGPLEETGRLMPTLIEKVKDGALPNFVDQNISRDFIYIDDVISAMLTVATKATKKHYGQAYNVATGKKTTMKDLASTTRKLFNIKQSPKFGTMKKRAWDLSDWVGEPSKIKRDFSWQAKTPLNEGLKKYFEYEKNS